MMMRQALAVLFRRTVAPDGLRVEKPRIADNRSALLIGACVAVSIILAIAVLMVLAPSVWRIVVLLLLLACPVLAVIIGIDTMRPLPVPLGPIPTTRGSSLNGIAPWYDSIWAPLFGFGQRFRNQPFALMDVRPGDRVLDAGCGTGWLSRRAAQIVGPAGAVHGVDPAPDMVRLARIKAADEHSTAHFDPGVIEALPFPDTSFDVVILSLVLHHLPPDLKITGLREAHRVLKPDGCLVVVEFDRPGLWLWRALLLPATLAPNLKDHVAGRTPDLIRKAGFKMVTPRGQWRQWVTFWIARKE